MFLYSYRIFSLNTYLLNNVTNQNGVIIRKFVFYATHGLVYGIHIFLYISKK